jgi:transposase-like protein
MATGGTGAADRDTVLGWMTRTGNGYAIAADHFGIKRNTVKQWVRRYVKLPAARTQDRADGTTPEIDETDDGVRNRGGETAQRTSPSSASRARATPAASLPDEDREHLRNAVRRLLRFLDSEDAIADPKKAADAARTLDTLLGRCPDILAFEDKTSGKDATVNNEAEQLADAFGFKLDGAA